MEFLKLQKDYSFSNTMVFKTIKFVAPKHFMAHHTLAVLVVVIELLEPVDHHHKLIIIIKHLNLLFCNEHQRRQSIEKNDERLGEDPRGLDIRMGLLGSQIWLWIC
jgi:hypothetical protein